jgi:myosin heavy subunit
MYRYSKEPMNVREKFNIVSQCAVEKSVYSRNVKTLLNINDQELTYLLANRNVKADQDYAHLFIPRDDCNARKTAIVRELYVALVEYVLYKINHIRPYEEHNHADSKGFYLLDFPGYDSLPINNLEQLMINLGNEKVYENLFASQLISQEKRILEEEGLKRFALDLPNLDLNSGLVKILESRDRPTGLLKLITTVSQNKRTEAKPKEAYKGLIADIAKSYQKTSYFVHKIKKVADEFSIVHSFYKVEYDPSQFIEMDKNLKLDPYFLDLVSSRNEDLKQVFRSYISKLENDRGDSLGDQYYFEMQSLEKELSMANLSYIFNLRVTEKMTPNNFNPAIIIPQVQKFGLEAYLKFKKRTYPIRIEYPVFCRKYLELNTHENRFFADLIADPETRLRNVAQAIMEAVSGISLDEELFFGTNYVLFSMAKFQEVVDAFGVYVNFMLTSRPERWRD